MPSFAVFPLAWSLIQATVASRSDITWESGTLETTFEMTSPNILDLRHIALPRVKFGSNGHVTQLGQPAADVLDVLVNAEDLLDHQNNRKRPAGRRHRAVGRNLAVGHGNLYLARLQSAGVGRYGGLSRDGLGRQGEPRRQRGDDKSPSGEVDTGKHALSIVIHRSVSLVKWWTRNSESAYRSRAVRHDSFLCQSERRAFFALEFPTRSEKNPESKSLWNCKPEANS